MLIFKEVPTFQSWKITCLYSQRPIHHKVIASSRSERQDVTFNGVNICEKVSVIQYFISPLVILLTRYYCLVAVFSHNAVSRTQQLHYWFITLCLKKWFRMEGNPQKHTEDMLTPHGKVRVGPGMVQTWNLLAIRWQCKHKWLPNDKQKQQY